MRQGTETELRQADRLAQVVALIVGLNLLFSVDSILTVVGMTDVFLVMVGIFTFLYSGILERGEGEEEPDGSAIVEHEVADPDWAVRHVLQYAGEAELLGPDDLRIRIGAAATNVERVHSA